MFYLRPSPKEEQRLVTEINMILLVKELQEVILLQIIMILNRYSK